MTPSRTNAIEQLQVSAQSSASQEFNHSERYRPGDTGSKPQIQHCIISITNARVCSGAKEVFPCPTVGSSLMESVQSRLTIFWYSGQVRVSLGPPGFGNWTLNSQFQTVSESLLHRGAGKCRGGQSPSTAALGSPGSPEYWALQRRR